MRFLLRHWLGSAVLLMFLWVAFALANNDPRGARLPAMLFWLFFLPWMLRGFVRFLGRAWHHSVRTGQ